ncbi:phasin family protein [Chitinibacter bivalviorum]|uniref:Phasin family protein n=1 Tax=Chitinibacter bivalviorum TaxID=2739434 RepID=A0A7H9BIJ9_9NEIS|nr:phasin family protein [Chitinibacter bivalviorum]QLG87374.1 phasin family protein [Chitinibacter bivalviorum]
MFNAQKQFAELSQANLEKSLRLTNIALAGAERLFQLQVGIARDLLAENAETAKSLAQVKNVQELVDLQKTLTQPSVEKNIAVARTIYEAASSTQAELNKLIEEQVLEFNKNLVSSLEQAAQQAPASGAAVNMFKNAVESANTAFETVQKTSQRIANDLTQATVAAVESGVKTVETVTRASKSA